MTPSVTNRQQLGPDATTPSLSVQIVTKSPEDIRPFPKATQRKTIKGGRKKATTRILTDTPIKSVLEEELIARLSKKTAVKKNPVKRKIGMDTLSIEKPIKKRKTLVLQNKTKAISKKGLTTGI